MEVQGARHADAGQAAASFRARAERRALGLRQAPMTGNELPPQHRSR
jgi:hypothetical protein